jgi:hypothetical protein
MTLILDFRFRKNRVTRCGLRGTRLALHVTSFGDRVISHGNAGIVDQDIQAFIFVMDFC